MVEKLFARSDKTYAMTVNILKTYGTAIKERLTTSQGGAAEFLEGGKLFDTEGAIADMMKLTAATSDPIESFFGIHDNVASSLCKNTSFHVTSVLATWRHNHTSKYLSELLPKQRALLIKDALRNADRLQREKKSSISEAAALKLKRLLDDAEKNKVKEKKLIHELLRLRGEVVFKTMRQYTEFVESVKGRESKIIKELKKQVRLLRKVSM